MYLNSKNIYEILFIIKIEQINVIKNIKKCFLLILVIMFVELINDFIIDNYIIFGQEYFEKENQ